MCAIIPVIPYAVRTGIRVVPIASTVVTLMIMSAIVTTTIAVIMIGFAKIEMIMVSVPNIDTEIPSAATGTNRPIEIIGSYETTIL